MFSLRTILVLAPLAVSACVAPEAPPSPPPLRVVARPAAPPPVAAAPSAWTDRALTPGIWTYRQDARGGLALYGDARRDALLTIRCDRAARRVYISRPGTLAATMTLRATSGSASAAARPTGGTPPYVAAELGATDRQLDALAFSRGRFMIGVTGQADIVVPSWPEVARVIEDCRG